MPVLIAQARQFIGEIAELDGTGLGIAVSLIAVNLVLLPRNSRRRILPPLALLAGHVLCLCLWKLFENEQAVRHQMWHAALFFLLACIGIGSFLFINLALRRYFDRVSRIFLDIFQGLIYVVALLVTLRMAGVELSSLIAGSALATAAVGLSMRDTLGNLFAGLVLQAQRPFEVGDWIQFDAEAAHIGQVMEINWRATTVKTLDRVEISIPNSSLATANIVNFTRPDNRPRRSIYFHAPYHVPTQQVQQIVLQAILGSFGVLEDPPPSVVSLEFDDRGVRYWLRFFTNEFGKRDLVDGGVRDRIWYALGRHDIAIPPRQNAVYLQQPPQPNEDRERAAISQRVNELRHVDFVAPLGEDSLKLLATSADMRLYAASETIIKQGTPSDELYILCRGEVVVLLEEAGKSAIEVARLGRHGFFGEMSLLAGSPRTATVRAAQECEVLVVTHAAFRQVLTGSPSFAQRIAEIVAHRQAQLADKRDAAAGAKTDEKEWGEKLLERIREFFSI